MSDGRSLAAWEVHDSDVFDSLDFVRKCVEDGVDNSVVLESFNEKDTAEGHQQTEVQTFQENVEPELREARPEAS
jgi:quinol monooxygenase YgiN